MWDLLRHRKFSHLCCTSILQGYFNRLTCTRFSYKKSGVLELYPFTSVLPGPGLCSLPIICWLSVVFSAWRQHGRTHDRANDFMIRWYRFPLFSFYLWRNLVVKRMDFSGFHRVPISFFGRDRTTRSLSCIVSNSSPKHADNRLFCFKTQT